MFHLGGLGSSSDRRSRSHRAYRVGPMEPITQSVDTSSIHLVIIGSTPKVPLSPSDPQRSIGPVRIIALRRHIFRHRRAHHRIDAHGPIGPIGPVGPIGRGLIVPEADRIGLRHLARALCKLPSWMKISFSKWCPCAHPTDPPPTYQTLGGGGKRGGGGLSFVGCPTRRAMSADLWVRHVLPESLSMISHSNAFEEMQWGCAQK